DGDAEGVLDGDIADGVAGDHVAVLGIGPTDRDDAACGHRLDVASDGVDADHNAVVLIDRGRVRAVRKQSQEVTLDEASDGSRGERDLVAESVDDEPPDD